MGMSSGGPRIVGGNNGGARYVDRGGGGRYIHRGDGRRHFVRHRFRGPIIGFDPGYYSYGYSTYDDCYQWRATAYGWRWVNVCYDYDYDY